MSNILVIDDINDNLISFKAVISDAFPDTIIYTALDGPKGIEIAIEKDPDVILLDILMPGMDGFEVCRNLKQDNRLKDIPVIFLTAIKETHESRIKALELGAEAFLSKPIDVSELTAQIRAMMKIKEANKQKRDEKEHLASLVAERTCELEKSNSEMTKLLNELSASENRYRSLFESAMMGVLIFEAETGIIIDINQSLLNLLGLSRDKVLGSRLWEIGELINIKDALSAYNRLIERGYTEYEVLPVRTLDGRMLHIQLISNFYYVDNKKVFQCNILDITERKLAEEQIKTLGKAIEQGPSSIVITDEKGRIVFVNKKFTSLTQYTLEEVKGKKPRILNRGHLSDNEFDAIFETLENGETWKGEVLNRRKDKLFYWEETSISTLMNPDGTVSNFILIMNDITEKRQIMHDLIKSKEKAEESDRLKSAFLDNMSHEIRTPLNCIIGFSNLLIESDFKKAEIDQFARLINNSGLHMLSVINDILDVSKIEAGQEFLKKDIFSVNNLILSIRDEFLYKTQEKGLELKIDLQNSTTEIYINSDVNKVRRVLVNLVDNAIKFSKEGIIDIGLTNKEGFVQFHVKDMGIGVSEKFYHKIFDRFCQIESNFNREHGGTGLGLSISKSLVELLGGSIWLESEVGKGSIFYFTIPV